MIKVLLFLCILFGHSLGLKAEVVEKSGKVDGQSGEAVENSFGIAVGKKGNIAYFEKHVSQLIEGQLKVLKTDYFLPKNDKVGEKFGSIRSDFTRSPYVPNYKFEDQRHARSAEVLWFGDEVIAYAKPSKDNKREKKIFKVSDNTVTGQGLHNYLRINLPDFLNDLKLKREIKFLIPMNQDRYSFRIRVKDHLPEKKQIKLRIEADSWLFRLVAPHIDVTYDTKTKRLLEYKGPSNLLDANGKKMSITISYKYGEV